LGSCEGGEYAGYLGLAEDLVVDEISPVNAAAPTRLD
jgi:hypothetical protein